MPNDGYFLHKKSLLDRFKDDHSSHVGYIQSTRAEHTWNNPLTRRKRTKKLNGWIKSFAGKRHIHKLSRFNAVNAGRNEGMVKGMGKFTITVHERIEPAYRVRYNLQDVEDTTEMAFNSLHNVFFKVDILCNSAPDGSEYGLVTARNLNSRYPYKWTFDDGLIVRIWDEDDTVVAHYQAEDLQDLYDFIVEEYGSTV